MRKLLLSILIAVLLSSCVYRSPFEDGELFSSMGGEGDLVVTVDLEKAREEGLSSLIPQSVITDRSDRLSVSISPGAVYGAAEGNFGYASVNAFFDWVPDWRRSEGDLRYYQSRSTGLEAAVPESGVLLFSTESYQNAYSALIERRVPVIADDIVPLMASSLASLYTRNAESVIDLGFGITEDVADNIEEIVFLLDAHDGSFYISGWIDMDSPSAARALVTLLRNELIKGMRERGEKPDFKALSSLYSQDGDKVRLSSVKVEDDQVGAVLSTLEEF